MAHLCFCSSFTPTRTRASVPLTCQRRVAAVRQLVPKRTRPVMEIDGGNLPNFPDDGPQEVQFFAREAPETPDTAPSSPPDPPDTRELALFPLQLVLNPGTNLPLHIFELRYRLLFNRVRDGDSKFGIVLHDGSSNLLASIGCIAELTRFEPLPDGRIMTNNIGRDRFKIVRIIEEKPYTRAIVQPVSDDPPQENLLPLVNEVWQALQDVLRLSNKLYDKVLDLSPDVKRMAPDGDAAGGVAATPEDNVPEGWPSPKRVEEFSFSVCQVLDMPLKQQQILLQMNDTGLRLRRQRKVLQTARQYLAAQVTIKEAGLNESSS